jgi:hypothetical protein
MTEAVTDTVPQAPAAPPPPAAPPSELAEIREAIESLRNPAPSIPALELELGQERPTYPDARSAASFLSRRRKDQEAAKPPAQTVTEILSDPNYEEELKYIDGRAPDAEVTAKQAAADIQAYRDQKKALLAQELGLAEPPQIEQPAAVEPQPEPIPEPDPVATAQAVERERVNAGIRELDHRAQNYADGLAHILMAIRQQPIPAQFAKFAQAQTAEDVAKLAAADPAGALELKTYVQNRIATVDAFHRELAGVRQQQAQIAAHQYKHYSEFQDELAGRIIPELSPNADRATQRALMDAAMETMHDAGFSKEEIGAAWNGTPIQLRDARSQKILADAAKWRMAQAKAKEAVKKPVPEVQRPGVSRRFEAGAISNLQPLEDRLRETGNLKDAVALRRAMIANRRAMESR